MWVLVSVWACLCLTVELLGLLRPHRRQLSLVAFLLTWNLRQRPQSCHFISHVEKLQLLVFSVMGLGLSFMNMNMNSIWCRFFHIRTEQKDKRTGEQCPAWMEIIFPQFLFKISLKFPTHLPVDVVLKTDGVRRGTIDWQLQNKTWTGRLKKKRKEKRPCQSIRNSVFQAYHSSAHGCKCLMWGGQKTHRRWPLPAVQCRGWQPMRWPECRPVWRRCCGRSPQRGTRPPS